MYEQIKLRQFEQDNTQIVEDIRDELEDEFKIKINQIKKEHLKTLIELKQKIKQQELVLRQRNRAV